MSWKVAIYLFDQAYGGSEEGGWWYETGMLSTGFGEYSKEFESEDEAFDYCKFLDDTICEKLNKDLPSTTSVLSRGRYCAQCMKAIFQSSILKQNRIMNN